jgi:hypothetical protein
MSRHFQRGDHLYVDYGGYTHHGIYYGHGKVIHYYDKKIRESSLKKFANGNIDKIFVRAYSRCSDTEKVRSRAKRKLGDRRYNLITSNCEHFATWCKTGKWRSKQVENPHKTAVKFVSHNSYKVFKQVSRETKKTTPRIIKVLRKLKP